MNEHVQRLVVSGSDVKQRSRFGRLRVMGTPFWVQTKPGRRESFVVCQCTCGTICAVDSMGLTANRSASCGCVRGKLARTAR